MIQSFVDRFLASEKEIKAEFNEHPDGYEELVKKVVTAITSRDEYSSIDPERIHRIDDGDYQGTLIFVIAEKGYQPSNYWYVKVGYGSCSGCDTLEGIKGYDSTPPTNEQINEYWTLMLHIVQGLKKMGPDET